MKDTVSQRLSCEEPKWLILFHKETLQKHFSYVDHQVWDQRWCRSDVWGVGRCETSLSKESLQRGFKLWLSVSRCWATFHDSFVFCSGTVWHIYSRAKVITYFFSTHCTNDWGLFVSAFARATGFVAGRMEASNITSDDEKMGSFLCLYISRLVWVLWLALLIHLWHRSTFRLPKHSPHHHLEQTLADEVCQHIFQ